MSKTKSQDLLAYIRKHKVPRGVPKRVRDFYTEYARQREQK
jgi:hypothetical protein